MALQLKDRILTLCTTVGTGDAVIGATKEGYAGWEGITYGNTVYYCITDDTAWEVGYGNYMNRGSTQAISRTVLSSSDNGAKIPLSGNSSIFCTYPSEKAVYRNKDGNLYFPTTNAHLKSILGSDVTSANVVTSAVIVDGTEGVKDENLAGLLNVYKKDEIDEQQEVQDVQIEKNKQNIIELEEEIEAIAPSFDRGEWDYKEPSLATDLPAEGNYFILDASGNSITSFANAHEVLFNNKDVYGAIHTWGTVEVGQYLELFDSVDGEYLLAKIEKITLESGAIRFEVTPQQSDGNAGGGSPRVRIKIFEISGVDVDTLMPKSGGTFTGLVKHKKEVVMEPTLPSRFINIKNRYATNADGTNSGGSDNQNFGVNFDLDHGNSGYNTVKWTTRNGNVFAVYGGTQANAKYEGVISSGKHLVNKHYVDSSINAIPSGLGELYTLQTNGNSYLFDNGLGAPTDTSFRTESTSLQYNKRFHLKKLYESSGANAFLKDYEATPSTMFEIYNRGVLQVRTSIKNFVDSDRGNNSMMFDASGSATSVHNYGTLTSSTAYQVVLTNMRKKPTSLRTKLADKQSTKTRN